MKWMVLFLLALTSLPARADELSSALGLALTPVSPWVAEAGESLDPTVAFQLRLPSSPGASFIVRRTPESARSLRGLWEGLRYTVVVEQGASILKDEQVRVAGVAGRQMIYETYGSGGSERHLEVDFLLNKELVVLVFEAPTPVFDSNLSSVRAMAASLRPIAPLPAPAVQP